MKIVTFCASFQSEVIHYCCVCFCR